MWGSAFHFLPLWARPCLAVSTELHYFVSLYSSAFCVTHQSPFTAGSLTPFFFFFFLSRRCECWCWLSEGGSTSIPVAAALPRCLPPDKTQQRHRDAPRHCRGPSLPHPPRHLCYCSPPPHHPSPAGCGRMLNLHLCSGRPYFFIPLHVLQSQSVLGVWGTPVSCPYLDHRHYFPNSRQGLDGNVKNLINF